MIRKACFLSTFCWSLNSFSAEKPLVISKLCEEAYVFTTYNDYKGTPYPANGLYLVTEEGVVLFDTPWDTTQCQPLIDSIYKRHSKNVILTISTHSHADRTGSIDFFRQKGIRTYTSAMTDSISKVNNERRAAYLFYKDTSFSIGKYQIETYYAGAGHTFDNIVLWVKELKLLYGGCFIKSIASSDLGNLADADPTAWEKSLQNLLKKIPKPKYIIPGHLDWQSKNSILHTLKLVKRYNSKKK